MKWFTVMLLLVVVAVISITATETHGQPKPHKSGEHTGSGSKGSGSKESGSKGSGSKESGSKGSGCKESGSKQSGSKESGSKQSGSKESGSNESGSKGSSESIEKPTIVKLMDVNRGVAHCGPTNVLNTCTCQLNELYWIPCMIEFLAVDNQPAANSCVDMDGVACFLNQFPCQCMPHCPNGYGCNATCVP